MAQAGKLGSIMFDKLRTSARFAAFLIFYFVLYSVLVTLALITPQFEKTFMDFASGANVILSFPMMFLVAVLFWVVFWHLNLKANNSLRIGEGQLLTSRKNKALITGILVGILSTLVLYSVVYGMRGGNDLHFHELFLDIGETRDTPVAKLARFTYLPALIAVVTATIFVSADYFRRVEIGEAEGMSEDKIAPQEALSHFTLVYLIYFLYLSFHAALMASYATKPLKNSVFNAWVILAIALAVALVVLQFLLFRHQIARYLNDTAKQTSALFSVLNVVAKIFAPLWPPLFSLAFSGFVL